MAKSKIWLSILVTPLLLSFSGCNKQPTTTKESESAKVTTKQQPNCKADIVELSPSLREEYARRVANYINQKVNSNDIQIQKIISSGNWSAANIATQISDPAWFVFEQKNGEMQVKDVWAGIAEESDHQMLINRVTKLGVPEDFAACFADAVIHIDTNDEYKIAFSFLQDAVKNNDKLVVANMVSYPFKTKLNNAKAIQNAEAFVQDYDKILTPQIKDVILKQKYDEAFTNQDGLMFGDGEVWLSSICNDEACENSEVFITAIQQVEK